MAKLLPHPATLLGVSLISACDATRTGPSGLDERAASAVVFPSIAGSYAGTATAHVKTSFGWTRDVSCPLGINIPTQGNDGFSGSFTLQDTKDCNTETGTLNGSVGADGTVTLSADMPGGGANIFEDAAARSGCTLISSSGSFNGSVAGNVVTVAGSAVYECRRWFGFRAYVEAAVSATKS